MFVCVVCVCVLCVVCCVLCVVCCVFCVCVCVCVLVGVCKVVPAKERWISYQAQQEGEVGFTPSAPAQVCFALTAGCFLRGSGTGVGGHTYRIGCWAGRATAKGPLFALSCSRPSAPLCHERVCRECVTVTQRARRDVSRHLVAAFAGAYINSIRAIQLIHPNDARFFLVSMLSAQYALSRYLSACMPGVCVSARFGACANRTGGTRRRRQSEKESTACHSVCQRDRHAKPARIHALSYEQSSGGRAHPEN